MADSRDACVAPQGNRRLRSRNEPAQDEADLLDLANVYIRPGGEFLVGFLGPRLMAMGGFKRLSHSSAELKHMRISADLQGRGPRAWLPQARVISLDYDLRDSTSRNRGNGKDAVEALARRKQVCPVIVHTSLPLEGVEMAGVLQAHGWSVEQVLFNRREAVQDWLDAVEKLIEPK